MTWSYQSKAKREIPPRGGTEIEIKSPENLEIDTLNSAKNQEKLLRLLEKGIQDFHSYYPHLGILKKYRPFSHYKTFQQVKKAYENLFELPSIWKELSNSLENLQSPEIRDQIYAKLREIDGREKSWFTSKRQPGVLGYLFPAALFIGRRKYPRLTGIGRTTNQLGLLGAHRAFRNAVLGDLNVRIKKALADLHHEKKNNVVHF